MARNLTLVTALFAILLSLDTFACSFAPGYRTFELSSTRPPSSGPTPATPSLSIQSIKRGTDDGNFASCSDAGVLTVSLNDPEAAKNIGFLFELESGSFPDKVLPDEIVAPIELADGSLGFYFVWLDLPTGQSAVEPIDVKVSVRAVSPTMVEGSKVILDIQSP
jgi:hypothetical protein